MPIGVLIDCFCVLLGGLLGSKWKKKIPIRIQEPLTMVFGISAIAIGIVSVVKLHSLPAVILALILGAVIGELLDLDTKVKTLFAKIIMRLHFEIPGDRTQYMNFYLIVAVTFCTSGTNIFGALHEGLSGDMTILLSKAVMDIFASVIFASTLGYAMLLIVIPQCLILSGFFYLSHLIMPLISETMMLDFIAVGGLLTFILGLNIAQIKHISAVNLLPALVLAFPVSYVFCLVLP